MNIIARRPWLLVVLAFVLLLGAWATLITLARAHSPEVIKVENTKQ